jgi:ribosomal protein S18 acetylase RimI-like enzyme
MFAAFEPDVVGRPLAVSVRRAEVADLDACAALAHQRNGGDLEAWRSRLNVERDDPERLLVVAEVNGLVVGHAGAGWLSFDPDLADNVKPGWYLTGVVVDPAMRRGGVGSALVRARLDWLDERSDSSWYFASAQNQASLALHHQFGFREVSRRFTVPGVEFTGGVGVLCVRFTAGAGRRERG